MNKMTCSSGFTLIEVIISIAILSVVSVIALQLFVTSKDMNTTSRHADIASVKATNYIETLKAFDNFQEIIHSQDDYKVTPAGYLKSTYLNKDFQVLLGDEAESTPTYIFESQLTKKQLGLYHITVTVSEIESGDVLASYATDHYFKGEVNLYETY